MKKFKCIACNKRDIKKKNHTEYKSRSFSVMASSFSQAVLAAEKILKTNKFIFESLKVREV